MSSKVKIIECPRDAMQGLKEMIPAAKKAVYINSLLNAGFDTIDFGSFVSPKVIPQMHDTAEVLSLLDLSATTTKLLVIVANRRGAEEAVQHPEIAYLGFPFSVSETFQRRNTNSTMIQSLDALKEMQSLCLAHGKRLVVYLSMAFGNPYNDPWHPDIVMEWAQKISGEGIEIIALADTIGVSDKKNISLLFSHLVPAFPSVEFGAHLHTRPDAWEEKIQAAYDNGCRRFDTAIRGFGGCPMAKDELVGNMPTEHIISYFESRKISHGINTDIFNEAFRKSVAIFA